MQLPKEARRFDSVNSRWKVIMGRYHAKPQVMAAVEEAAHLLETFRALRAALETTGEQLSRYLHIKRRSFGRFYLMSNDALLGLLSCGSHPTALQVRTLHRSPPGLPYHHVAFQISAPGHSARLTLTDPPPLHS